MKKIICGILAAVLCMTAMFSLTSCDRQTLDEFAGCAPDELYEVALASIASLDNFEIVHEQNITVTMFYFIKNTVNQTVTIQVDGDEFHQNIESDVMDSFLSNFVTECWYVDGTLYGEYDGTLRQQDFEPSAFEGSVYDFDNGDGILLNLPEEWFVGSCFYQEGDEVYLEFIIDGDSYCNYVMESGGDLLDDYNITADNDVTYRVYFHEDGMVDRITTLFEYTISFDDMDIDLPEGVDLSALSAKTTLEQISYVRNVGNTSITLPAGAESAPQGSFNIY